MYSLKRNYYQSTNCFPPTVWFPRKLRKTKKKLPKYPLFFLRKLVYPMFDYDKTKKTKGKFAHCLVSEKIKKNKGKFTFWLLILHTVPI